MRIKQNLWFVLTRALCAPDLPLVIQRYKIIFSKRVFRTFRSPRSSKNVFIKLLNTYEFLPRATRLALHNNFMSFLPHSAAQRGIFIRIPGLVIGFLFCPARPLSGNFYDNLIIYLPRRAVLRVFSNKFIIFYRSFSPHRAARLEFS